MSFKSAGAKYLQAEYYTFSFSSSYILEGLWSWVGGRIQPSEVALHSSLCLVYDWYFLGHMV